MPVVDDYTALLSGSYWNGIEVTDKPVIVTFSFPTTLPSYDASIPGFTAATDSSFTTFTAAEQTEALQALGEWSAASGLVFLQVAPGEGDINFSNIDFNTTVPYTDSNGNPQPSYAGFGGIGFYPFGNWDSFSYPYFRNDQDSSGDIFMNSQFLTSGSVNYGTLLHEIGHAIGLKHPTETVYDGPAGVNHDQVLSSDDPTRTIMATVGDDGSGPAHLLPLDQEAAAAIYGPAGTGGVFTASATGSNSVSNWVWDAATETLTQTAATTNDTIRGSSINDIITGSTGDDQLYGLAGDDLLQGGAGNDSLYGGTGNDTLVGGIGDDSYYIDSPTDVIVENPNEGSDSVFATVSFKLPDNVESLSLYGSGLTGTANDQGGDSLFGDGTFATKLIGGAGQDYLVGGAGNDTITGGTGPDIMYGQGGDDIFVFQSLASAPPNGFLSTIGDFTEGQDKIDLSGIKTTGANPGQDLTFIGNAAFSDQAGQVHEVASGSNTIVEGDVNGDGTADFQIYLYGAQTLQQSDFIFDTGPLCFLGGTRIATPDGERPVESLAPGDTVTTFSGAVRRIVWIGEGRQLATRGRRTAATPVIIRQNALGPNTPYYDLRVTKAHALYFDGVLVPVEFLVNHRSILWDDHAREIALYHIELETHEILLANGAPAESYRDDGNRWLFQNANTGWDLPPQPLCCPLLTGGPVVDAIWRSLLDRAGPRPSLPRTDDADLHLVVDGRRVDYESSYGQARLFRLPAISASVRLVSRAGSPAELGLQRDPRVLGVAIRKVTVSQGQQVRTIDPADPLLATGFYEFEPDNRFRWTNGDAALPASIFADFHGPIDLVVQVAATSQYPLFNSDRAAA